MSFEQLFPFEAALAGPKILVTGHTGFTGAQVSGLSPQPHTVSALHEQLGFTSRIPSTLGDICDCLMVLVAAKFFD